MGAPSEVTQKQLDELHIALVKPEDKSDTPKESRTLCPALLFFLLAKSALTVCCASTNMRIDFSVARISCKYNSL